MGQPALDQATALGFFARMNEQGVDYAVLRNYEEYPKFGHDIDLVVRWDHLPKWRAIAASCAADYGWSVLTECDHWAKSGNREHTIQILRFYRTSPLAYLQIDAFHAQLVNSLPVFGEDMLLGGRIWDQQGFYRIDERAENFFRLFQVARLAGIKSAQEKLKKYRDRVLSFWNARQDLATYGESFGFSRITAAMEHLEAGDLHSFKRSIDRQKRAWWVARMLAHPWRGSRAIFNRVADYARLFYLRPCGFVVRVSAVGAQRERLTAIMGKLVDANLIPSYSAGGSMKKRQQVMERGGVVVKWERAERADVILDDKANDEAVIAKLAAAIIDRHARILDLRESAN
jgi:hypothetical protein